MNKRRHLVARMNYCDGGEGYYVGFSRVCSKENIRRNVEGRRAVCSSSPCEKDYDRGLRGHGPHQYCYESHLFKDWEFGVGWRSKKPLHLRHRHDVKRGVAIVTTLFPGESETDRRIVGLFRAGNITQHENGEDCVMAGRDYRVRLPLRDTAKLRFWRFYRNKNGTVRWSSSLVRYLSDRQVLAMLRAILDVTRDSRVRVSVSRLIREDFRGVEPGRARSLQEMRRAEAAAAKHGAGVESKEHRLLKQWVYNNPRWLGLQKYTWRAMEYEYDATSDRVDVAFGLPGARRAVIEVETIPENTVTGAHQALKYRTLMCAELGLPIDSPKVKGFLVAPEFSSEARAFCRKYGIKCYERKLG